MLQHHWPIEQCFPHIRVFFGGKTKSLCFDLFIHWLIKQIMNTYRNHFSRSYENRSNMLFSHVKISSFRAKAHLVFHWCLYNKLISLISLTVTYLLTHSFTFTILYLSIYQFIFHSLINLHQVIKVRLHSYFHTYVYTRHSLTKFLLLGNEVFFFS